MPHELVLSQSQEFQTDLNVLIQRMVEALQTRALREDWTITQSVNSTLAYFMHNCFAVMDRGYVMKLVSTYAATLSEIGNHQLVSFTDLV